MWSFFFRGLSGDKWARLGVNNAKVRELLGAGAYEFNELIHNTPPQDVVESIVRCGGKHSVHSSRLGANSLGGKKILGLHCHM